MKDDKELMTKNILETAESASAYADACLAEALSKHKKQKLKLIKITGMMLIVSVLLVFATRSWFTMSKEVEGTGANMTAEGIQFELAVPSRSGAETYYNTKINSLGYLTGNDELITSKGSIRWVMNDESPYTALDDYNGIRPGSYGSFTFYIIPNSSSNSIYSFALDLSGYYAEFIPSTEDPNILTKEIKKNGDSDIFYPLSVMAASDTTVGEGETSVYTLAADYLSGHILFFENYSLLSSAELNGATDTNYYYSNRITESFTYNTAEHQDDKTMIDGKTAYEVNLYWVWPNTFGQIVFDNGAENLHDPALFSSKQSGSPNARDELISYISNNPKYYFSTDELLNKNSSQLTSFMSESSLNTTNALISLSNGYNGADQIIGENVKFLFVELTAKLNTES